MLFFTLEIDCLRSSLLTGGFISFLKKVWFEPFEAILTVVFDIGQIVDGFSFD